MTRTPASATGQALRALRKAAGLTLEHAASLAGISPSYLSRAEGGDVTPTANWVAAFVQAIGAYMQRERERIGVQ